MKKIRSRMATDTLRYTGAVVASRIPPFLFLPVYASVLQPEDLGLYLTAMILVDLVQTLSSIGMVQALFRFFPKAAGQSERKAMLGTALMTGGAGGALISALFMGAFCLPAVRESLEATRGLSLRAFVLALTAGGFINMMSILTAYVWAERRTKVFLAAMGAGAVLETALSFSLVSLHGVSLERILAIECAKDLLVILILAFAARRDFSLRFHPETFATLFRFGVWLMPMGLFSWMFLSIDRFWLGQMAGLAQVGVYGFFYKFASPAAILFQSYIISLDSHLFKAEGAEAHNLLETSLARYLKGAGILLAGAALAFPVAVYAAVHVWKVLPPAYLDGMKTYPLLLATTYVFFWAMHYASMLDFQLRSKRQSAFMAVTALGNFALCPAFIAAGRRVGIDAMASVAMSNLTCAAVLLFLQSRGSSLAPERPQWRKALPALASMGLVFLLWNWLG